MRYIFSLTCVLMTAAVVFACYVRLVPLGGAYWSVPDKPLRAIGDYPGDKTFEAVRQVSGAEVLDRLHRVALATPRTQKLPGDGADWVTYVTRSRLMGYPDYTSARVVITPQGPLLQVYARSRFGKLDLGVNKARVRDWLKRLAPLTQQD